MELALGTVTVIALVMTVAMGVVTWRLVHEERRRSAARLAALETELRKRRVAGVPTPALPTQTAAAPAQPTVLRTDRLSPPHRTTAAAGELFATTTRESGGWSRRAAGIGMAAVLVAAVISVAVVASLDGPAEPAPAAPVPATVELLALEHAHQGAFLAITGAVRLAADAMPPSPLAVRAMIYDEAGQLVASARVPSSDQFPVR